VTQEDWKKQAGLLRFGLAAEKPTGMPLMLFVYPCMFFARDFDPREFARESLPSTDEVQRTFSARLREAVYKLLIVPETGGNADERWYWLAPMLLDQFHFPDASKAWWQRGDLVRAWAGTGSSENELG
jgi:hypothetical protein